MLQKLLQCNGRFRGLGATASFLLPLLTYKHSRAAKFFAYSAIFALYKMQQPIETTSALADLGAAFSCHLKNTK